jgi:Leucine-rich repeat (LRR) protein
MKYLQLLEKILKAVRTAIQDDNFENLKAEVNLAQMVDVFENFAFYFVDNIIGGHKIDVKHFFMLDGQDPIAATNYMANEIKMFYEKTRQVTLDRKRLTKVPIDLHYTTGVTSLDLSHNDIVEISPMIFKNNTNISFLTLKNNLIRKIPTTLGNLTNLSFLQLDGNPISELPKEIGKCTKLLDLTISNTNITTLPKELAKCTKLISVYIGSDKITNLAEMKKLMPKCNFVTKNLNL